MNTLCNLHTVGRKHIMCETHKFLISLIDSDIMKLNLFFTHFLTNTFYNILISDFFYIKYINLFLFRKKNLNFL